MGRLYQTLPEVICCYSVSVNASEGYHKEEVDGKKREKQHVISLQCTAQLLQQLLKWAAGYKFLMK